MSLTICNVPHVSRVNRCWSRNSIDLFCGSGALTRRRPWPQRSTERVFEVREGADIAEDRAGQDPPNRGVRHPAGQREGPLTSSSFGHRRTQRPRHVLRNSRRRWRVGHQLPVWPRASGHVLGGWSNPMTARHHPTIASDSTNGRPSMSNPYHSGAFTHQHGGRITDGPAPHAAGCVQ